MRYIETTLTISIHEKHPMNTQNSYRIRDHPQSNKKQPLHTIEHISARVVVKVANNDVGPVAVDLNSIETHNNYAHELSGLNNIHGINARVIRKRGSGADNPSRTVLKKLRMTMRNASELANTSHLSPPLHPPQSENQKTQKWTICLYFSNM